MRIRATRQQRFSRYPTYNPIQQHQRHPLPLLHRKATSSSHMKPTNVLLAVEDDYLRQDITSILSRSESSFAEQDPRDWPQVLESLHTDRPDILLVELNAIRSDITAALRAVKKSAAQTKIVALHPTDDPQMILTAIRAGASEFVHQPY